jgi:hypothetical protein
MKESCGLLSELNSLFQFEQKFPALLILPKIENLVNEDDPTLSDVVTVCKSNGALFHKLTHHLNGHLNEREVAKEILLKKGMGYLLSVGIRTMNQEIFSLPVKAFEGLTEFMLKRRSIILGRYLKKFSSLTSISPDHTYLCGLFYNFRIVCFEYLVSAEKLDITDFNAQENRVSAAVANALESIGYNRLITGFLNDSSKDIYETKYPLLHALTRIGNTMLVDSDKTGRNSFRNTSFLDSTLVEATGLSLKELTEPMKETVRDFKGGTNRQ